MKKKYRWTDKNQQLKDRLELKFSNIIEVERFEDDEYADLIALRIKESLYRTQEAKKITS